MLAFNALDFCIAIFFILVLYISSKADFFVSVFNLASAAVAFYLTARIRPYLTGYIAQTGLDTCVTGLVEHFAGLYAHGIKEFASYEISKFLLGALLSVAIFFIISFLMGGLRKTVKTLSRFFILRALDRAAAVVFGSIIGVVVLKLLFAVIFLFFHNYYAALTDLIKGSYFMRFL